MPSSVSLEKGTAPMYRLLFLALARNQVFKKLFIAFPLTARVLKYFVAGPTWEQTREVVARLLDKGLKVSLEYLCEDGRATEQLDNTVAAYTDLLEQIDQAGWAGDVEVSVKPAALGLLLHDGEELALANTAKIAAKATAINTSIIMDMAGPATVSKTLRIVNTLREQYSVDCVVQANYKRTERDCHGLDGPGSRVRLCKGSFKAPAPAAYTDNHDIDLSYVRCLKTLMEGEGTPLVATHDPVMIEIAQELAAHTNRGLKDFEFQMLYGIRTLEQERLIDLGHIVRVNVPFGENWYDYLVQRLAERPGNLRLFLRALVGWR